ncbi:MAG: hypothetical protein IT262_19025 [Saprospiraceae bacterium]|nr:hypothetical protein [Saprospiraceae bacterium]
MIYKSYAALQLFYDCVPTDADFALSTSDFGLPSNVGHLPTAAPVPQSSFFLLPFRPFSASI